MSSNILSTKENNLEEQEYPLVDRPCYVDRIAFKVDNSEQWLIDTDYPLWLVDIDTKL